MSKQSEQPSIETLAIGAQLIQSIKRATAKSDISGEVRILNEYLTCVNEKQAAALLGCSVAQIRKWRLAKRGPKVTKMDKLVRYRICDLMAYVEQNAG